MEGKIHNKDKSKMTQCNAAHLKTDDSQEEAPVTMINLWEEEIYITKNWLAHRGITLFYLVLLYKTLSEHSNCKYVIRHIKPAY